MYRQLSKQVNLILKHKLKYVFGFILVLTMNSVFALSTDKQQDIEIEADFAEMDDLKGIAIYKGDVVVTQGSIRMTGHTMTVHFADNGDMELVIMQGRPGTYRQLPDDSKTYDEAEARQMEYYALKDYIILTDNAVVTKPNGSRMSGSRIEYDTVLSKIIAKGSRSTVKTQNGETNKKKDDHIKITIEKKKQQ